MGWKAGLATAGALTLGLAACGDSDDGEGASTSVGDGATTTAAAETTAPPTTEASDTTEAEAGPTRFSVSIENLTDQSSIVRRSGVFNTPEGADEPGPAVPGGAYVAEFEAAAGERLSFATMFVQSNDWIISTHAEGLALFDDEGQPISGDVTAELGVYDVGTEVDQEPGVGADQAPRQAGPDTGDADPDNTVRPAGRDAAAYVAATVTSLGDGRFELRIENVSETASTPTPLAPGVWVAHADGDALFAADAPHPGNGLEALAEDGDPSGLADWLSANANVPSPLAPGVVVVGADGDVFFVDGESDRGLGLEALAEDGDPAALAGATGGTAFAVPDGGSDPAPALPGSGYSFEIEAAPGDRLDFATMLVQTNDWFFAPGGDGVVLFAADGSPISGDITDQVSLWDAGTEVDQTVGIGADQAPRQAGPNTGDADPDDSVRRIGAADGIRVTVAPLS